MALPPVDTSMTGYVSGSVDKQDDIYRNRRRPQARPIVQNDSGYGSGIKLRSSSFRAETSTSLLTLANSVRSTQLLDNDFNFASSTTVECYESDACSTSKSLLKSTYGFLHHERAEFFA